MPYCPTSSSGGLRRPRFRTVAWCCLLSSLLFGSAASPVLAAERSTAPAAYDSSSSPSDFFTHGDLLFFTVTRASTQEIWRTDGTPDGTLALCDHCRGTRFLGGAGGGTFFFTVDDAYRVGWTDGSRSGTRLLSTDFGGTHLDGGYGTQVYSPTLDRLLFLTFDSGGSHWLWTWDGGDGPAKLLRRFEGNGQTQVGSILDTAGAVYLVISDFGATAGSQSSLWTTDGTPVGTHGLGPVPGETYSVGRLAAAGSGVVASASTSACDVRIWYGSTSVPPRQIAQIADARCRTPLPVHFRSLGDRAVFTVYDTVYDHELWTTDGTAAGTRRLSDFADPHAASLGEAELRDAPGWNDLIFFVPEVTSGVWRTDGTAAGTAPITDSCGGCAEPLFGMTAHRESLFWSGRRGTGHPLELWNSDGYSEARLVGSFGDQTGSHVARLVGSGDHLFAFLWKDGSGLELWSHPIGSSGVTRLAAFAGFRDFPYLLPGALDGRIFFAIDDGVHGSEPWVSDGTPAGTRLFADLVPAGTATELPAAPWGIDAQPSADQISLRWNYDDYFTINGRVYVEMRSPGRGWEEVAAMDSDIQSLAVWPLEADTPYSFRLRVENAAGFSPWSETFSMTTGELPRLEPPCQPADDRLCFQDGRFGVRVHWWDQHNSGTTPRTGVGRRVPDAAPGRSGYFWFFKPDNVELIVKLLDGGKINGHAWTFYGALTDVEYWVTVDDHWTGSRRTYYNPPGEICGRGDTAAFHSDGQAAGAQQAAATAGGGLALDALPPRATAAAHPEEPCVEDATTLCLLGGRYRVTVDWQDQHNQRTGVGGAVPYADRSGFFWFFKPDNIELVVKVLDGTPVNGKVWVLYGALTDVGYTLTVTDTATGHEVRRYVNEPGSLCGDADTAAFDVAF